MREKKVRHGETVSQEGKRTSRGILLQDGEIATGRLLKNGEIATGRLPKDGEIVNGRLRRMEK